MLRLHSPGPGADWHSCVLCVCTDSEKIVSEDSVKESRGSDVLPALQFLPGEGLCADRRGG